jgi:hypothetical protein
MVDVTSAPSVDASNVWIVITDVGLTDARGCSRQRGDGRSPLHLGWGAVGAIRI